MGGRWGASRGACDRIGFIMRGGIGASKDRSRLTSSRMEDRPSISSKTSGEESDEPAAHGRWSGEPAGVRMGRPSGSVIEADHDPEEDHPARREGRPQADPGPAVAPPRSPPPDPQGGRAGHPLHARPRAPDVHPRRPGRPRRARRRRGQPRRGQGAPGQAGPDLPEDREAARVLHRRAGTDGGRGSTEQHHRDLDRHDRRGGADHPADALQVQEGRGALPRHVSPRSSGRP